MLRDDSAHGVGGTAVGAPPSGTLYQGMLVMPRVFARSGLFAPLRHHADHHGLIPAWHDQLIIDYQGKRLTVYDQHIYLTAVAAISHAADEAQPACCLPLRAFCRAMACNDGGRDCRDLRAALQRLAECQLAISYRGGICRGPLLHVQHTPGGVQLAIPDDQAPIWQHRCWLDQQIYRRLHPALSRWLYVFMASHNAPPWDPSRISLRKLHVLSGSSCTPRKFRERMRHACRQLMDAAAIESASIDDNDILTFNRYYTPKKESQ